MTAHQKSGANMGVPVSPSMYACVCECIYMCVYVYAGPNVKIKMHTGSLDIGGFIRTDIFFTWYARLKNKQKTNKQTNKQTTKTKTKKDQKNTVKEYPRKKNNIPKFQETFFSFNLKNLF